MVVNKSATHATYRRALKNFWMYVRIGNFPEISGSMQFDDAVFTLQLSMQFH